MKGKRNIDSELANVYISVPTAALAIDARHKRKAIIIHAVERPSYHKYHFSSRKLSTLALHHILRICMLLKTLPHSMLSLSPFVYHGLDIVNWNFSHHLSHQRRIRMPKRSTMAMLEMIVCKLSFVLKHQERILSLDTASSFGPIRKTHADLFQWVSLRFPLAYHLLTSQKQETRANAIWNPWFKPLRSVRGYHYILAQRKGQRARKYSRLCIHSTSPVKRLVSNEANQLRYFTKLITDARASS
jgi:hypothetical protein